MDPAVMKVLAPPVARSGGKTHNDPMDKTRNGNYPYNQGNTPRTFPAPGTRFYTPPGAMPKERPCYGCGEKGHTLPVCPKLIKLQADGKIIRNSKGQVRHPNGDLVRRMPEESLIEAFKRETKGPASHFVSVGKPNDTDTFSSSHEETDESTDESIFAMPAYEGTNDDDYYVYPVERGIKSTVKGRHERFDGVYLPPKNNSKGKEGNPASKSMPAPRKNSVPVAPKEKSQETRGKPTPLSKSQKSNTETKKLVTPQEARFQEDDEDIIMEDPDIPSKKEPKENTAIEKKNIRQRVSDLAARAKPEKVLESVLRTPVSLEVGQILGTSRELSGILSNVIKPKPMILNEPKVEAHSIWTKTRGLLIKMIMHCDDQPIQAIIDTGSQLNIVSRQAWKTLINRPMDIGRATSMNDANGGEGQLRGLVQNVPLSCGGVHTQANLYVGDHVPFSLLLGRPWQRGNYVTIDERKDGTWLLFKDPTSLQVQHELLCTPDGTDPSWTFEPATWLGGRQANNLLVTDESMDIDTISEHSESGYQARDNPIGTSQPENIVFCNNDVTPDHSDFIPPYWPTHSSIKEPESSNFNTLIQNSVSQHSHSSQEECSKNAPLNMPNHVTPTCKSTLLTETLVSLIGKYGDFRLASNFDNALNTFSVHLTPAFSLSTPSSTLPSPLPPAFSPVQLANTAEQEESSTLAATSIPCLVSPTQNVENISFEQSTTSTNLSMGDTTIKCEDGEGEEDLQSMEHGTSPHSYTMPGDLTSVLAHVLEHNTYFTSMPSLLTCHPS